MQTDPNVFSPLYVMYNKLSELLKVLNNCNILSLVDGNTLSMKTNMDIDGFKHMRFRIIYTN